MQMTGKTKTLLGIIVLAGALAVSGVAAAITVEPKDYSSLGTVTKAIVSPKIEQPEWLKKEIAAEKAARAAQSARSGSAPVSRTISYMVSSRGTIRSSLGEFKALVSQTLNDSRGWAQLGLAFREVASGGSFTIILAEASEVAKFSSGCSSEWSCRVGQYVIVNDDRWSGATTAWNSAGGSLRNYRHYVVNHEVGHWLGHEHRNCSGAGRAAPVMLQQSIDLQGCSVNPWPLASELSAPNLGL